MTDSEIAKALECCIVECNCANCPLYEDKYMSKECVEIEARALDLIKRQKAEIERLKSLERNVYETVEKLKNKIETEARKEFAERLKGKLDISACGYSTEEIVSDVEDTIDNLLKEMEN